jgi:hypothetical protein
MQPAPHILRMHPLYRVCVLSISWCFEGFKYRIYRTIAYVCWFAIQCDWINRSFILNWPSWSYRMFSCTSFINLPVKAFGLTTTVCWPSCLAILFHRILLSTKQFRDTSVITCNLSVFSISTGFCRANVLMKHKICLCQCQWPLPCFCSNNLLAFHIFCILFLTPIAS